MAFIINNFQDPRFESKQRINLSSYAWDIINSDRENFNMLDNSSSFSGFLNTIFTNFYQQAKSSSNLYMELLQNKLKGLPVFSNHKHKNIDLFPEEIDDITKEISKVAASKIREEMLSYPKDDGQNFTLNKQNKEILQYFSKESDYYNNSIPLYLKAIYEEYSRLPTSEREKIYFKDIVNKINQSFGEKKQLKISLMENYNPITKKSFTRTFYISPYKILSDKTNSFNYLIGISKESFPENKLGPKTKASFRISRIKYIYVMSSLNAFISNEDKSNIDNEINQKTVQYMAGETNDIVIKFSKKGLLNFKKQIYLRPKISKKIDDLTYQFNCTELQAINYFFKFGQDAIVLSPLSLQEKIYIRFKEAYNEYEKQIKT